MQVPLGNVPKAKSEWNRFSKEIACKARAAGPGTYVLEVLWEKVPALLVVIANNLTRLLLMLTTSICLTGVAVRLDTRLGFFLRKRGTMLISNVSAQNARRRDLELGFERVLELEGDFMSMGVSEGVKMGSYLGELQGIWSGIDYGFRVAAEASFYNTSAEIWAGLVGYLPEPRSSTSLERLGSNIRALGAVSDLLLGSCSGNPCDFDVELELSRARCKHTVLVKFLDKFTKRTPSSLISMSFLSQSDVADALY